MEKIEQIKNHGFKGNIQKRLREEMREQIKQNPEQLKMISGRQEEGIKCNSAKEIN